MYVYHDIWFIKYFGWYYYKKNKINLLAYAGFISCNNNNHINLSIKPI